MPVSVGARADRGRQSFHPEAEGAGGKPGHQPAHRPPDHPAPRPQPQKSNGGGPAAGHPTTQPYRDVTGITSPRFQPNRFFPSTQGGGEWGARAPRKGPPPHVVTGRPEVVTPSGRGWQAEANAYSGPVNFASKTRRETLIAHDTNMNVNDTAVRKHNTLNMIKDNLVGCGPTARRAAARGHGRLRHTAAGRSVSPPSRAQPAQPGLCAAT